MAWRGCRAVAGEAGVAFISSSAAEFIELYMGLGAARVRDLFNTVREAGTPWGGGRVAAAVCALQARSLSAPACYITCLAGRLHAQPIHECIDCRCTDCPCTPAARCPQARSLSPCIIFIDELDAVGRARQVRTWARRRACARP